MPPIALTDELGGLYSCREIDQVGNDFKRDLFSITLNKQGKP
jgi:hypothetical protein